MTRPILIFPEIVLDSLNFEVLGPVPDDMRVSTVGRKDHSKGYVSGNYRWQSSYDNNSENALRNQVAIRPEVRAKNARWHRAAATLKVMRMGPVTNA